jgi:hypothetical protein
MGERRIKLRNGKNRKRLEEYDFTTDGPFKKYSDTGAATTRVWVKFGQRPPSAYMPAADYCPSSSQRIVGLMQARNKRIAQFWNENKTKKAWALLRPLTGATQSTPPVEGLVDENGKAHFDVETKNKMMKSYIKELFQKQPADTDQGWCLQRDGFYTIDDLVEAARAHNASKAIGDDDFDSKGLPEEELRRFAEQWANMLNTGTVPDWLKEAKMLLLAKKNGSVCTMDEGRII